MKYKIGLLGLVILAALSVAVFLVHARQAGCIRIEAAGCDADLNLRGGWWNKAVSVSGSDSVEVQAGTYKPQRAVLRVEEDSDTWWAILCRRGPWGKLATINVASGQTTVLKLGPPLAIRTDVQRKGQAVSIGLSLIGRAGEQYSPQVLSSDGPSPAPKLRIVAEAGTVLASGQFEYG